MASDGKESQRRTVSEKFATKRGSESDSESERNNRVSNTGNKNQRPASNHVRGLTPALTTFDNKNAVTTTTTTNSGTSRTLIIARPVRPSTATEKKEEIGI